MNHPDPITLTKKIFAAWETNLGCALEKTMRRPETMQMMARTLDVTLPLYREWKRRLPQVLRPLGIPTDEELHGLYATVHDLETRLIDTEEELAELRQARATNGPEQPKPRRSRRRA